MKTIIHSALVILISILSLSMTSGGVSGGGGNLISPKKPKVSVKPEAVKKLVFTAHSNLTNYIAEKFIAFKNNQLSAEDQKTFAPVFTANKNIEDVIQNVQIQVLIWESCRDEKNLPVDGSTITSAPNSICISAFNISRKVDMTEISSQATALMLHEYSELVGLSELQAVRLQTAALNDLKKL
ncbi:hypothetical protein CIK05_06120 [Bdellovibrio sp. qaytius]|nr:hypothetical protein CIK05_06120 [Bdellovibrio sp. qaytius]